MPARNTLVQLLALYTNPKSHSAQRHGQTDRQTTYDVNTALCTKVHRAVKSSAWQSQRNPISSPYPSPLPSPSQPQDPESRPLNWGSPSSLFSSHYRSTSIPLPFPCPSFTSSS